MDEKQAYEVLVQMDEDDVRTYLVYARSHKEAERLAEERAHGLIHARAVKTDNPRGTPREVDYDDILG